MTAIQMSALAPLSAPQPASNSPVVAPVTATVPDESTATPAAPAPAPVGTYVVAHVYAPLAVAYLATKTDWRVADPTWPPPPKSTVL
jgi:hypothetical protein